MGKIKFIFCEGGANSLDRKILEKTMAGLSSFPIIVPSGGKGNMPNFMLGYMQKESSVVERKDENAIGFRDRDFDAPVPGTPQLVKGNNPKIYLSHRATIENYLLHPKVLFQFVHENKIPINIGSIEDANMIFREEAEKLKYYSAARHSLGAVRQRVNLGTTWTAGSGTLPISLERDVCFREAFGLVEEMQNLANGMTEDVRGLIDENGEDNILTNGRFKRVFDYFCGKFDERFFESKQYMVWFHGKDLQKAISQREAFSACQFPFKKYYEFALKNFDYTVFPDLVELHSILAGE